MGRIPVSWTLYRFFLGPIALAITFIRNIRLDGMS